MPVSTDATFLFADLAGYTALTEAHGDEAAADIATDFCHELNRRLPGCAEDIKMLGDACLVRAEDAGCAVDLGVALVREVGARHGFPQIRVGLHTGGAVQRGGEWFGGAINTAARVVAMAGSAEVLLTAETLAAAGPRDGVTYERVGIREARHLSRPLEIHRAVPDVAPSATEWAVDPVCHMRIDVTKRATSVTHEEAEYSFCSALCAEAFSRAPERYARADE